MSNSEYVNVPGEHQNKNGRKHIAGKMGNVYKMLKKKYKWSLHSSLLACLEHSQKALQRRWDYCKSGKELKLKNLTALLK